MNPEDFPAPTEGSVIAHFLVVSDQDLSTAFYQSLLDSRVLIERDPVVMKVANPWLIANEGGGPTDDKPTVTLTTPPDPDHTSAFLSDDGCPHVELVAGPYALPLVGPEWRAERARAVRADARPLRRDPPRRAGQTRPRVRVGRTRLGAR